MGDRFQVVVDVEATEAEAEGLADTVLAWLVDTGVVHADNVVRNEIRTEGLEIYTRRTVFLSMIGEYDSSCPLCGWSTDPFERGDFGDTLGAWVDGGPDELACLACGGRLRLNDWLWTPPWGFGCLGFRFWNWPVFSREFLDEFATRLGHRTVHPYGKL